MSYEIVQKINEIKLVYMECFSYVYYVIKDKII